MRLLVAIMLCSSFAMASGKFTVQANGYENGKKTRPVVGLAIYEPLFWKLAFNSWVGYGESLQEDQFSKWFTAKAQIDLKLEKLTISPGYAYQESFQIDDKNSYAFIKLDYQLW